jgi:hypothetical protein
VSWGRSPGDHWVAISRKEGGQVPSPEIGCVQIFVWIAVAVNRSLPVHVKSGAISMNVKMAFSKRPSWHS